MFKRVQRKLAIKFTIFVSLLLLVSGGIFIIADYVNGLFRVDSLLARDSAQILARIDAPIENVQRALTGRDISRTRILTPEGKEVYVGGSFKSLDVPFSASKYVNVNFEEETYRIITVPITAGGQDIGFLQLSEREKIRPQDLMGKLGLFLLVALAISSITYLMGLYFARRSLIPVRETTERLEQFTQDASHELRTPLATIGSSLDLAIKTGKYKEGILSAKEHLTRASLLVERLLNIARMERFAIDLTPVTLSNVISQTISRYEDAAREKGIALESDIATGITVRGDEFLLSQLFGNLFDNALKFNVPNGRVDVMLNGDHFRICNSGPAIDTKDLSQIFDPFFQSDSSRSKEGFGLGLTIVKKIVDLHGWRISVDSSEDTGTQFTISFG
jgi:signal transduction histidine kinase